MKRISLLRRPAALLLLLTLLAAALPGQVLAAPTAPRKTVRVGFFAYDGYHMMDEDGVRSGYGYDFLRLVARYLDVDFDYVGYDKSWDEMQQMLADGEIDLLTSVEKTPEREELFDFSKPIGTGSCIITVRSGNGTRREQDYTTYDNMRVGLMQGSSWNQEFDDLAQEKGFTYTPVYFPTEKAMVSALQSGAVDALAGSSLRTLTNEHVVEEFATKNFYAAVKKGNTSLLRQINYAIDQLNAVEGDWMSRLKYQYYSRASAQDLSFSQQEQDLLEKYRSGGKILVAACSPDRAPYSYVEDGQLKGIIPDLFARMMEKADIPYRVAIPKDRAQYTRWQQEGIVDVFMDCRIDSETPIEDHGDAITASYMDMRLAMVTRRGFAGHVNTVAVAEHQGLTGIEEGIIGDAEEVLCTTRTAALKAVQEGRADATFTYLYTAQQWVNQDERGLLTYTPLDEPVYPYRMIVTKQNDHALAGILTKCIYGLSTAELESIVSQYTSYKAENTTLYTFVLTHPVLSFTVIITTVVGVVVILAMVLLLRSRQERLAFERQKAEEMDALAKQAQAASDSKSRFLFNMSHDIRTPLNAILGFSRMAMEPGRTEDQVQDDLSKIQLSGSHLLEIINDILEMSRIESGKSQLDPRPGSIAATAGEVAAIIQERAGEKGQTFVTDLSHIQDDWVEFDPVRIKEILLNLLSNAVKFTPAGGTISYTVVQLPCEETGVALYETRIKDSGCGISPEFMKKLFEPFERERNSTVSGIQGTGLGLSIAKRFVDMMGGTLQVESKEGEGTEVILRLRHPIAQRPPEPETPEKTLPPVDFSGKRLLLAEDNELNREVAQAILEQAGFTVDCAENGAEAVERLEQAPAGTYSAVLMDIQMPVMDGYEATRAIRALSDPEKANVPILALSANAFEEDRAQSLAAGMNGHLAKPIDVAELLKVLGEVLES